MANRNSVYVGGEYHLVSTSQTSKTVWWASGMMQNEKIVAKGRSEPAALKTWQDLAEYKLLE